MNILIDNLLIYFFIFKIIINITIIIIKIIKIIVIHIVFCPVWDSFSSEDILYVIT